MGYGEDTGGYWGILGVLRGSDGCRGDHGGTEGTLEWTEGILGVLSDTRSTQGILVGTKVDTGGA